MLGPHHHLLHLSLGHDLLFCLALWSLQEHSISLIRHILNEMVRLEIRLEFFGTLAGFLRFNCQWLLLSLGQGSVLGCGVVKVIRAYLFMIFVNLLLQLDSLLLLGRFATVDRVVIGWESHLPRVDADL